MKVMKQLPALAMVLFVAASSVLAQNQSKRPDHAATRNARPQAGPNRVVGQANSRGSSPAPGRSRIANRAIPDRRNVDGRGNGNDRLRNNDDPSKGRRDGERRQDNRNQPQNKRPVDPRMAGFESPRKAIERGFRNRLSQIEKLRDRALETGKLDLLDLADRLELDARRKYAEMTERLAQRQVTGKPGIGPPSRLPMPSSESPAETTQTPNEPTLLSEPAPDTQVPDSINPESDPEPADQ